jgi:TolA-binding protein
MAALGVVLALLWRSIGAQLWSDTQKPLSFAAASSSSASSAASSPSASSPIEEQLGRIARDLDSLRKNIDELRAAQQQTVTNVTSLQAAQQELQRRASSLQSPHWYSDSGLLTHPTAPAKKPAAAAAPKRVPTARAPAQTLDANVGRNNNDDAPVSLVSPGH